MIGGILGVLAGYLGGRFDEAIMRFVDAMSLLYDNPINRYLVNSSMLPNLKQDADGGLTLFVQHDSPGGEKEVNWLPAPEGPIILAMRL
ncbi:hypothetical protein BC364_23115 [Ensifer sp. LC499]|nr:hypothetical protein BBX50_23265 [Ensifer sp. LC11]OCP31560.1 hypothetical protein BC364_23115 [Ensifer sp. LC499]